MFLSCTIYLSQCQQVAKITSFLSGHTQIVQRNTIMFRILFQAVLHPISPFSLSQQFSFLPKQWVSALVCAAFCRFSWLTCKTFSTPVTHLQVYISPEVVWNVQKRSFSASQRRHKKQGQVAPWSYFSKFLGKEFSPRGQFLPSAFGAKHGHTFGSVPRAQLQLLRPWCCAATLGYRATRSRAHPLGAACLCCWPGWFIPGKISWEQGKLRIPPGIPRSVGGDREEEKFGLAEMCTIPSHKKRQRNLTKELAPVDVSGVHRSSGPAG